MKNNTERKCYEPKENINQHCRVKYTQTSIKYMQNYVKSKILKTKKMDKKSDKWRNWNQKHMEENHKISEMKTKFQSSHGD